MPLYVTSSRKISAQCLDWLDPKASTKFIKTKMEGLKALHENPARPTTLYNPNQDIKAICMAAKLITDYPVLIDKAVKYSGSSRS